jgi:hypothetical protein
MISLCPSAENASGYTDAGYFIRFSRN